MSNTVGLALIVKDEEKNLPRLFDSIRGCFDQIVIVDTGSTDGTENVIVSHDDGDQLPIELHSFEWIKDFAAARNYADSLLTTDWCVWADADDIIIGAENIRGLAGSAPADCAGFITDYDYAQHPETGACVCVLKRERIVRRGLGRWEGHVHEAQVVAGGLQYVSPEIILWKHQKMAQSTEDVAALRSNERNLEILFDWYEKEPRNARVLAYLGTEHGIRGEHEKAINFYQEFLNLEHHHWTQQKAQVYRRMCESYMALGRHPHEVEMLALSAIGVMPDWPDSYITLAEVYLSMGEFDKALHWCDQCLSVGAPETLLIVNPLDYTFAPRALKAKALAGLRRYEEAVQWAEAAIHHFPDQGTIQLVAECKGELKMLKTAETFCMCAQALVNHDEQAKALILLEQCVPHFATDHPMVVAQRSMLRERLMWVKDPQAFKDHYEFGGSKPEDFIPDDQIDNLCERLPRGGFILDGLGEQINGS